MAGALLVGTLHTGVDDVMGGHHSDRRTALVQGHTERMESRVRYAEIRPYTVPETLEELAGPAAGVVALPTALDWTPKRVYDLSDDADLRMFYETVIREAMHAGELRKFLDPVLLSAVWQRLWLPPRVRLMWEGRFPQLARRAA